MQLMTLFLLLILILTGCSTKQEVSLDKPLPVERIIPGLIPESIIQKAEKKYSGNVRKRYEAFNAKLHELQNTSTELKLKEVNDFFNKVPYADDINIWGKQNYWATPLEFLGKDKGDCEDYVIAKYVSLRNLGIESKKLYLSYVRSIHLKKPHMVLSYFETPYSVPLILDNMNFKIFPADKRKDLTPVYNYNGETLYRARQNGQNGRKAINHEKVHNKWNRLMNDIKKNKL